MARIALLPTIDWGIPSDGTTDATAAFNAFLTALAAAGVDPDAVPILPGRTFKIAGTLTIPTSLTGLTLGGIGPRTVLDLGSTGQITADNTTSFTLRDLKLTGTSAAYLFHCQGATDPTIINVLCNGGQRQLYFNTCARPRTTGTRHTAPNTAGAATTLECITCYQCTDPVIDQPIVEPFVAPVNASNFAPIRMELSTNPVVNLPQVTGVDMSQTVASAGVMFDGCAGGVLNAPQVSALKGADGIAVINNGATRSTDVVVTGGYSTGNNPSAGAGTNTQTGDGLDIFESDRVLVTGINLRGNGTVGPHYNLEIASCTEVQVENVNASDGGYGGVSVNASTDTKLGKVVARRNKGSGCYVQGASTNTALVECDMTDNNQGAGNPAIMQSGVYVGDSATVRIIGGRYTDTRAGGSKTQQYGINAQNTSKVYVTGKTNLIGNAVASILDGAGFLIDLDDTLWDGSGISSFFPGGTPYTQAAGPSRETMYLYNGTVSSVTLQGTQIAVASPTVIHCEPHDTVVITWTNGTGLELVRRKE